MKVGRCIYCTIITVKLEIIVHLQAMCMSPNYIKLGTFPDDPLPPESSAVQQQSKPNISTVLQILLSSGKTVKRVLPDGNCFFRSLSFCFYQTEDHHSGVRQSVVTHIKYNQNNYAPLLFRGSMDEHIQQMAKPCVWATQVELQAAANCYSKEIFVLTETPQKDSYHWMSYKPRIGSKQGHIQLAHFSSVHFDPVIDVVTQKLPQSPPQLGGSTIYFEEVL